MLWLMSFTTYTSAAAARAEGVALIKNPCGVEISLVRVNTDDREMPRHSAAALLRGLALSILFLLTGSLKFCIAQQSSTVYNDTKTLLEFKASADPHNSLVDWSSSDCCLPSSPWIGVTCQQGRVWRLVLAGVPLSGDMEALSSLSELRVLSISDSKLHGFLPNLSNWRFLWLLNLSSNMLSGPIPLSIGSLTRLWRVDLSRNLFSGAIPSSINSLPRLLTLSVHSNALNGSIPSLRLPSLTSLFLQQNNLSGSIPPLYLPNLTSFDVSANNLSGLIPSSLTNFPPTAFLGNVNLCGRPLGPCKNSIMSNPASPMLVPSHPGTFHPHPPSSKVTSKLSYGAIIAIVIGDVIILLLLILIFVVYYWKRGHSYGEVCKKTKAEEDAHYLSSLQVPDMNDRNKLVFFSDVRRFELEDLLRASAEMLGKGSFGTTYKAVLEDGHAVTVKRLKEIAPSGRREFDQHMQLIGSLHHPNIVPLRAYYSAKDEKLLVYDYMPNGSLYTLLHGECRLLPLHLTLYLHSCILVHGISYM
ncbi:hypothetical protein KP509_15G052500 [Ceratopteris richardii]|uniref:Protein kinase domain-containing protein n=1 Tax=Ceratopteris richardii TaxID=49495 RepID=A0A8T2T7S9_CERRI|nr:hypothetical protein KP509_15G052500 [Ceratopteris richardii]